MKNILKLFGIITLALVIGLSFITCGDDGNAADTFSRMAFSPNNDAYILSINNSGKSLITRALEIGSVYDFTIVKPNTQSTQGAANSFKSEIIKITVQNKETLGGGKERFTVLRSDNNTTFRITFDNNGIYSIQGLQGAKEGFINPIGNNNNSLDGAYAGFMLDNHGNMCAMNFLINGNQLIMGNQIISNDPQDAQGSGTAETIMTITSRTGNTVSVAENQSIRFQTDKVNTGLWVPLKEEDVAAILKSFEYTLNGDILIMKIKDIWAGEKYWGDNDTFEFKRVPTN